MYPQFYKLSAEPFRLSPDHSFAYSHKGYNKARAYMEYALMRAEGFVMITGQPGTGKTTLVGALTAKLSDSSVSIANLVCTQLEANDLLKMVSYEFGVPVTVVEKGELLQRLTLQLKAWHRDGRRALLIVDEAQDLSISAMEELRLLTNIQVGSTPLLQIFLLGQPELRSLILSPQLEQVHQRIIAATHMKALDCEETEAYIRHRLTTAQWRGDPAISKSVYPLIHKFSEGVPRRINLICSRLFLHCAVEEKHQVSVADLREVIDELQSEHLASGGTYNEMDFLVADVFEEEKREEPAVAEIDDITPPDLAVLEAEVLEPVITKPVITEAPTITTPPVAPPVAPPITQTASQPIAPSATTPQIAPHQPDAKESEPAIDKMPLLLWFLTTAVVIALLAGAFYTLN